MIVKYAARSVFVQKSSSLITLGVLGSTTALVTVLWAVTQALMAGVHGGGDPSVAVVVSEGSDETSSSVPATAQNRIGVAPGVATGANGPLISAEFLYLMPFIDNGQLSEVRLRGVDPIALDVRRSLHVRGRLPARLEAGVVIGANLVGKHTGFVEGGTVRIGKQSWPVLGILEAADSPAESEIWIDRALLHQIVKDDTDSTFFARLTSPAAQEGFAHAVAQMLDAHLKASSEPAYLREQVASVAVYFDAIYLVLVVLVLAMILISANTIYTSFLGRTRELAALLAIGFTRRRVMAIMTIESLILTGLGAGIGLLLSFAAYGQRLSIDSVSMVYTVKITPAILAVGLAVAAITGVIASVVANVQIARIDIVGGLRE